MIYKTLHITIRHGISYELGMNRIGITTNGRYPWSFVAQKFGGNC